MILNGDALEGVHHKTISQLSQNDEDQRILALRILAPVVERCEGRYFHIRGTEAHAGASGNKEALARELGALPNEVGQHARWEIYKRVGGRAGGVVHVLHHIGTTGSQHYESSAVMRELVEAYVESGRWCDQPLAGVVRAHRHRAIQVRIPAAWDELMQLLDTDLRQECLEALEEVLSGRAVVEGTLRHLAKLLAAKAQTREAFGLVTPGWQLKTPLTRRIAGARQAQPQFGGAVIGYHKEELYARLFVVRPKRPKVE